MAIEKVDRLLAELRQLLRAHYEQGGSDALKRILSAVKEPSNRNLRATSKRAGHAARSAGRAASHQ